VRKRDGIGDAFEYVLSILRKPFNVLRYVALLLLFYITVQFSTSFVLSWYATGEISLGDLGIALISLIWFLEVCGVLGRDVSKEFEFERVEPAYPDELSEDALDDRVVDVDENEREVERARVAAGVVGQDD
jgi:hypothetical protein